MSSVQELVKYGAALGEDTADLERALELMLSVPHRAQDHKFISSIEGYRGSLHKLGRLIAHEWFSVVSGVGSGDTVTDTAKDRYVFLFKARLLVCKVRRVSDERSVFQLKLVVRLPDVQLLDLPHNTHAFRLLRPNDPAYPLTLAARKEHVKPLWLEEIREFATDLDFQGTYIMY